MRESRKVMRHLRDKQPAFATIAKSNLGHDMPACQIRQPEKTAVGGNVHQPPPFESLCAETRLRLSSVERALSALLKEELSRAGSNCHSAILPSDLLSAVARLHHPLSEHFIAKHLQGNRPIVQGTQLAVSEKERVSVEENSLPLVCRELSLAIRSNDPDYFVKTLADIASQSCGRETNIRAGDVSLGVDQGGQYWAFPHAERVIPLLRDLHANLKTARESSTLFAAIVALVNINCIHPFMDGNGRTSRIVFNAMLVDDGLLDPQAYIPCKHIYAISKYGFEIRLRQIILKNEWLPMITYFIDLVDLFCALAKGDGIARLGE